MELSDFEESECIELCDYDRGNRLANGDADRSILCSQVSDKWWPVMRLPRGPSFVCILFKA